MKRELLVFNLATDAGDPILGFTLDWIAELAAHFSWVHVITMRRSPAALPANVTVHSLGKERGYSRPRRLARFYGILGRALLRNDIGAAFFHMTPLFAVLAAPLLRAARVRTALWYAHPKRSPVLRFATRVCDAQVTTLPRSFPFATPKLQVIGQGIDTGLFRPALGERDPAGRVILCAGRLSPSKDHFTLLRAVAGLGDVAGLRVEILGGVPQGGPADYLRTLREEIARLGLEEVVAFHPPVVRSELPGWYSRAAVHVNLTGVGFSDKVALEAMACEIPCIVANPDFAATLGRYAEALTFEYGDPASLAERLRKLLARPEEERREMGAYLREQVIRLHDLRQLIARLASVLTQQAAPSGPPPKYDLRAARQ
jgi:glycosyltransferase involved in cell wall biosynthesis